ncbi:hypothetical protein AAFF_G00233610 [Aldrovandia affinis]|uniref:EMILIN-2-like n=1 Tax=Aldrovandia affinis TaxID=143900 RepID=A0AAD7W3I2_9TELE|nr:hypothetical protein AAFF_G00233610 [Aldrovandia affinis]
MKRDHIRNPEFNLRWMIFPILLTGSLVQATPSSYDLFQGSAYSGGGHRHRNKNWCARVVYKNVTCAVLGSAESFLEPEIVPCPPHQPDCAQRMMYRTQFRPTYRIAYKTVTELEWKCCPGFQGPDCKELKGATARQPITARQTAQRPRHQPQPIVGQVQHTLRPGMREAEPQVQGGDRVWRLEGEMQRLSQTVLDLQAAMTGMNENLRLDIQEDTSKMLLTLLNTLHLPDSALTGTTESIHLAGSAPGVEQVMTRLDLVTDTLKTKSDLLDEVQGTLSRQEGQIRLLMEASQGPTPSSQGHASSPQGSVPSSKGHSPTSQGHFPSSQGPAPSSQDHSPTSQSHSPLSQGSAPSSQGQSPSSLDPRYIDSRLRDLREELLESMEIKMASLKSSCNYDMLSLRRQCEEQGTSYLSLAQLLDNKEADLRKEIRDLRLDLGPLDGAIRTNRGAASEDRPGDGGELRRDVERIAEAHRILNVRVDNELAHLSMLRIEDVFGPRLDDLEDRINVTERNSEALCFYVEEKLGRQISNEVAELRRLLDERLNFMEDQFTAMLVEISNSSFPNMHGDALEGLRHEVSSNRYQLQGLEEKLNALGKQCSTDCGAGPQGFDAILRDVRLYRSDLDTMHRDVSGNSEKLSELEALVQRQRLIIQHNSKNLSGLQATLSSLQGHVGGLEGSVNVLGETLRKQVQGLQGLNTSCGQSEREAPDSQPATGVNSSQVEELRGRLDELSRQVRAELARRSEGVAGGQGAGAEVKPGDVSDSLRRVADTLNRHVASVWARVQHLYRTQQAQAQDVSGLKASLQNLQAQLGAIARNAPSPSGRSPGEPVLRDGKESSSPATETKPPLSHPVAPRPGGSIIPHIRIPPHQPNFLPQPARPVMETGEAGPPGSMPRMGIRLTLAQDPLTQPFQGYAGAPGYPPLSPVSYKPNVVPVAIVPHRPAERPGVTPVSAGDSVVSEPFSFSAGLTTVPSPWHMGVIRFNKVLVNDGEHYNPQTGIFTVPQDGHYLVSAVLTAQRGDRVEGSLSVSGRSVQRLTTAGSGRDARVGAQGGQGDCACGGSASISLILQLKRGDRVAMVMTAGKLAVSQPREVLSTFSAIFLYSAPSR